MRLAVLTALIGGALLFAVGAYREGSHAEALVMLLLVFVAMGVALWARDKGKDKNE